MLSLIRLRSVLMQWAEGGSLDDFIDIRLGRRTAHPHIHPVPAEAMGSLGSAQQDSGRGEY